MRRDIFQAIADPTRRAIIAGISHRQACKEAGLARSTSMYHHKQKNDSVLIEQLQALVHKHPAIGF